jgi:hypothetical protein
MKSLLTTCCFVLFGITIHAQIIDIASAGGGSPQPGQSFNETRGADVTVLQAFTANKITLHHFNTGNDSGFVGLRIYETATNTLLYSEDKNIAAGNDLSIPFNTNFLFQQGKQLRVCFYAYGNGNQHSSGSHTGYKPTFPYTESESLLKVNQGYSVGADSFPINFNQLTPYFTIDYTKSTKNCCCNCILIYALLVLIVLLLLWLIRCCKKMMERK